MVRPIVRARGREVERIPIGGDGRGIAEREQQVAPQRGDAGELFRARAIADGLHERERVTVHADRGLALGRAQQVRDRFRISSPQ